MATVRIDKNVHPNTCEENEKILIKLRTRGKIDDRTKDELDKFFVKLNTNNVVNTPKTMQSPPAPRQDPLVSVPIYGPISGFPPGSWWGIRMDLSRDKVHVSFNKDIDEGPFGAASICTSHVNPNGDVDVGDYLTITGADYSEITSCADALVRSFKNQIPVRLIRGYNLANQFAPKTGYRYDGLYVIISSWIGASDSKKSYKFALARLNHQEPPPWQSTTTVPEPIPAKKTRNKSKITQRCHMDCCKTKDAPPKDKKVEDLPMDKLSIIAAPVKVPEKQTKESTIVMRHVSKKCESLPGVESPILTCSPKSTSCKLQNTNISIRTDLYDSSPNLQQDGKKPTPMTFCRIYKSTKPVIKPPVHSNAAAVINLNTFAPGAKDKVYESQIQMRSGITKVAPHSPVPSTTSTDKNYSTPRNISSASESSHFTPNDFSNTESKDRDKNTQLAANTSANDQLDVPDEVTERVSASRRSSDSSIDSMVRKHRIQNAVVSLESMTPEQMVNLIVQQRYKVAGKLLIGNIIGDPNFVLPNENKDVNVAKPTSTPQKVTPKSSKVNNKTNDRSLYSLRSKPAAKEAVSENKKNRPNKSVKPKVKPNSTKSKEDTSKLKSSKKSVKSFSKPSAKKRASELANLVIDANFVAKTRGPRTRRFPYAMRVFSKRRDNLRHLKGRSKVDLSKKTSMAKRNAPTESKNSRVRQNRRPQPTKKTDNVKEAVTNAKRQTSVRVAEKSVGEAATERTQEKKPQMVDAIVQCTLQKDASTSVNLENSSHNEERGAGGRIKWVDLEDVKSESSGSDSESLQEVYYRNSSVQTVSQETELLRPNCIRRSLDTSARLGGLSAFVPVNMSDVDFRVARLRSIGFKPIDPCVIYSNYQNSSFSEYRQSGGSKGASVSSVVRRDVNEQYKKYTSEENSVVGYMDDELRYQDIEDEENGNSSQVYVGIRRNRINAKHDTNINPGKSSILRRKRKSNNSLVEEEPWRGWKKFVQL